MIASKEAMRDIAFEPRRDQLDAWRMVRANDHVRQPWTPLPRYAEPTFLEIEHRSGDIRLLDFNLIRTERLTLFIPPFERLRAGAWLRVTVEIVSYADETPRLPTVLFDGEVGGSPAQTGFVRHVYREQLLPLKECGIGWFDVFIDGRHVSDPGEDFFEWLVAPNVTYPPLEVEPLDADGRIDVAALPAEDGTPYCRVRARAVLPEAMTVRAHLSYRVGDEDRQDSTREALTSNHWHRVFCPGIDEADVAAGVIAGYASDGTGTGQFISQRRRLAIAPRGGLWAWIRRWTRR